MTTIPEDLSDDAKAVGFAFFPTADSSVKFRMIWSVPSDQCQAALDELVSKGFATVEDIEGSRTGGKCYRAKESFGHLMKWSWDRAQRGESMVLWHKKPAIRSKDPA